MTKYSAFFVTPIGEEGSSERKRADDLLGFVLDPVFGAQFEITRADLIDDPGNINHDIIERLYSADLVIADLTGFNPNVMYEVGVRHSFNMPIIQIAQKGAKLPFDVATERTIFFDVGDLKSVEDAKKRLKNAVGAVIAKGEAYQSPIFGILNKAAVFEEGGDFTEALETMSNSVDSLAEQMWDVVNNIGYNGRDTSTEEKIERIFDVVTAIPPWEAERLIDKLRKL